MELDLRPQRGPYFSIRFLAVVLRDVVFFANAFGWRRSGNTFLPVERFHSSYWSSVILPSTSSCANFRRCAMLLKGIKQRLANAKVQANPHTIRPLRPNRKTIERPAAASTSSAAVTRPIMPSVRPSGTSEMTWWLWSESDDSV